MPAPRPQSHKLDAVRRVSAQIAAGSPMRSACRAQGVPVSSFQSWQAKLAAGGESALLADYRGCGRPAKFEVDAHESNALRSLVLVRDSQTFAIEEFARTHPECRPETREKILAELDRATREHRYPRWPVSLRRAVAVTSEDRALLRGSKHFDALSFSPRKGLFFTDEEGRRVSLRPHTAWVMDDYSTNEPYIVSAESGAQRLCRQTLAAMDVACDAWLGVEMVGRERDAYRGEDILRFILRCIDGQGTMPLYLMLERGRWDSQSVHGLDLERELGPKFKGRTWGALDELFGIIHGFSSRHKAQLESSFNILQRALAHSGREIGRHASEFERATKDYLAVQAGRKDARSAGFLSIEEARQCHWRAMQYLNGRGKHRAATGLVEVPDDLMAMWDAELDARRLPESERWRFLPVKRLATVRGGFVELSVTPYPRTFRFQINGTEGGLYLPGGYRVLVAFDPAMPAMGARICNGETGTANRDARPIGEFLATAPDAQDAPQFDLRGGGYADSGKKKASAAARTAFASINPHRRGLAVDAQHDGRGTASVLMRAEGGRRRAEGDAAVRKPDVAARRMHTAEEIAALDRAADEHFAVM
jgi:hypothetical protein